jgi:transposase
MVKIATAIHLTPEEERRIRGWIEEAEKQQLRAERAKIVLLAAQRWSTQQIARALGVRIARVSKWRTRFAAHGLAGLENAPRPGKPRSYDLSIDARILSLAGQAPPEPHLVWTGPLLARVLDVSAHHVWKVLRINGISLRKADPRESETRLTAGLRLAGITGLYLTGEICAFLVGVSDPDGAVAPARLRCLIRTPTADAAAALRARASASPTLQEALQWAAALAEAGVYKSPVARTLEHFLSDARRHSATADIHAFVLSPQAPILPGIYSHAVPAFAAWRDQLESWLAIFLSPTRPGDPAPVSQLLAAVERFVLAHRRTAAAAFEWHTWPLVSRQPVARSITSGEPEEQRAGF